MRTTKIVTAIFLCLLLVSMMQGAFLNVWQIKSANAVALPFFDGLESGDTSNFDSITETGGGDVSVTSSVKYAGTYAANCSSNADDGEAALNVVVNSKVIVAQTMFNIAKNITRVGNGGSCNTLSFSGTDSLVATLRYIYFYGEWRWRLDLGGSADWVNNYTKGLTMSASNWYQLTLIYNVTGEFVKFLINDTLTYQWTGLDDTGSITQVRFRCNPDGTTGDDSVSIFDNIAVDDDDILSNLIDDNPVFSGLWIDKVQVSQSTNIAIKWMQDSRSATNLNASVFSWNSTGPYVNTTLSISGHSAWHNFTKTNNDTASTVVGIKLYCNNTDNEWTTTEFAFTTMSDSMMLHNVNGVLKDEAGKAVYLRGTGHIHGYTDDAAGGWIRENGMIADSYTNDYAEDKILDNLKFMSVWGIDHIRFHVNTAWWEVGNITDDGHTVDVRYAIKRLSILAAQYGLYLIMNNYDLDIDNSTGFVNWWGNVTKELRYYSNIVFEIRNEPSPTDGNRDAWMATMQDVIDRIRSVGASNPIILMGSGGTVPNSVLGWKLSMEWALPEHYNFTDSVNDNLVYSGHLYRTWMNPVWHPDWNYTSLYTHMEDTYFRQVQETTHRPVIVGEMGVNMWEDNTETQPDSGMTNQTEEVTWAYNVMSYANNCSLGYSVWNWIPNGGDQWYLHSSVNFNPSKWGIALIQALNPHPFVWTVGATTSIYLNASTWSESWSGTQLNVTYSGSAQVRVFWNVSSSFPLSSSLYCKHSNGTLLVALDFYDSSTNLLRLTSTSTGSWLIGYNLESMPPLEVALNTPADLASSSSFTVNFVYTPTVRGDVFYHSELWLNLTGIWQIAAYNSSLIANYTTNTITYVFSTNNTYIWNVKIWNSTTGVFASSTRTLTIAVAGIDWYSLTVNCLDLSSANVNAYVTKRFYNSSTLLTYAEGSYSLLSGTITVKAYYLEMLVNSTDFLMATYGNTTIIIYLQMKAHTAIANGYIAFNNTVTTLTIISQTSSNLTFTVTGSGSFSVTVGVPSNYTYIQKAASNMTGWVYDSATSPDKVIWNSSSLTASYQMIVSTPASEDDAGFDWPDWNVYLPNFSLNIYTTLMILGALPLVVAMMYAVALFLRGTFPPVQQLVEVVGVLAMVSFLTLALVPVITAILEGYGFG